MIRKESLSFFGVNDENTLTNICTVWHNDRNKHWRWSEAEQYDDHKGKILDMAAGVGTFLLYGLHQGYDIYGIEPEKWKLDYINNKITENKYPEWYSERIIQAIGENIPFPDNYFDYVTSYQTIEHVQDVEKCLSEMLRVLKPGGKLKINAPDYRGWFEPHYMLPFLPTMNRQMARIYLKLLRRPTSGLDSLNWTTAPKLLKYLNQYHEISYLDMTQLYKDRAITKIQQDYKVPALLAKLIYWSKQAKTMFKQEQYINLVIRKSTNKTESVIKATTSNC